MSSLPSYLAAAKPLPAANRQAWFKNIAPTYAGIMLWFVYWQHVAEGPAPGGVLSAGIGTALLGVVIAALACHFLCYLVPGLLGQKTGLPLYIVATSTYGAAGALFMPGFLMGLLQFGGLAVNAFAVSTLLCECFRLVAPSAEFHFSMPHAAIASAYIVVAAFVGLKGIHYVAKVATYLPLIPLAVLILLFAKTAGGLSGFDPRQITLATAPSAAAAAKATTPLDACGVLALLSTYIIGFVATAGAAGADIASNGRNRRDVQLGGLVGISLATIFSSGMAILIVAGAYGAHMVHGDMLSKANVNPIDLMNGPAKLMNGGILHKDAANVIMILLAISSIPGACFSSYIAANSFRTTLPKVHPLISVALGSLAGIVLAVTGLAGAVAAVYKFIGALFSPVCGAMVADYFLAGRKWAGPRAGFNPAGWISWIVGFAVGAFNVIASWIPAIADKQSLVPVAPLSAFVVGFVLYAVLTKIGCRTRSLEMPGRGE